MGFDLFGESPKNKKGAYFRNNVWYWRPLWQFVCQVGKDVLTIADGDAGNFNDGYVIDKETTDLLIDKIERSFKTGEAEEFIKNHKSDSYFITMQNIEEFLEFLKASGGFSIS